MKKILGALLLLGAVVAALLGFYTTVDSTTTSQVDAMRAIPADAALIAETGSATDIWRDLSQSSVIWDELQATDLYFRLNAVGTALDSVLRKEPDMRKFFAERPVVLSVHSSGARSHSFLLAIPLVEEYELEVLFAQLIKMLRPQSPPATKMYDGVKVTTAQPSFSDVPISFFADGHILVVSLSSILAEEAVRALNLEASVLADEGFSKVRTTADRKSRAQVYVNHTRFANLLGRAVKKPGAYPGLFEKSYASWSALDLTMKSNALMLNGFVQASDSMGDWLSNFSETSAPQIRVFGYMPVNTAYFAFHGYGDFNAFYPKITAMREVQGVSYKKVNALKPLHEKCDCDIEALATGWFGSQSVAFITEPAAAEYTNHHFMLVHTDNREEADQSLEKLQDAFGDGGDEMSEAFEGHLIRKLNIGRLYGVLLGASYDGLDNPYAVRLDDMVLMSNSLNALRTWIQQVEADKVLEADLSFAEFSNQLSSDAHFMLYSALSRSAYIYQHVLDDDKARQVEEIDATLKKFQGFAYQVSHYKEDLFYSNIYFRHNPVYEQETASIWEVSMRDKASGKPHLVKNHYTGALEVLIQDAQHRIGLYANTGKLLWEAQLDGPIIGEVHQVDIYKNRKLQMFFSTERTLYLLDRNGNKVERYPVSLPALASAPATAVDYDKSRDYRFFAPLTDGRILVYEATGKQVDGWKFKDAVAPIIAPVEHIRVRGKDFIFAANANGDLHLLDRKGNTRHQTDATLPAGFTLPAKVQHPEQIISSGGLFIMDSLGVSYRVGFDDRTQRLDLGMGAGSKGLHADLGDGAMSYIYASDGALVAFDSDGKTRFESSLEEPLTEISHLSLSGGKHLIAGVNSESGRVYVFDSEGQLLDGFPLVGHSLPAIGDLNNDGTYKLVTATHDGFLYGYSISLSGGELP